MAEQSINNKTVKYILQNKGLIQSHMLKHRTTWNMSSSPSMDDAEPVQIYIRVRPLLANDISHGAYSLVDIQPPRTIHLTHPTIRSAGGRFATKTFHCGAVFGDDADNNTVYAGMGIEKAVDRCLNFETRELSILAYGQTGTGKTFSTTALEENIMRHVFRVFEAAPGTGEVTYPGLTRHQTETGEQLRGLVSKAKELRLTRSTLKNSASSRSHSVMRIHVQSKEDDATKSQVNIIDLAGSERSHVTTQHDPDAMKESIETNKSLAVLKDCIRSRLPGEHVRPPSPLDVEDTLNTLRYVAVFQLGALGKDNEVKGVAGATFREDVSEWSHEDSLNYISRHFAKLVPVSHRLLPTPTSTMCELLPLSVQELSQRCSTPTPDEGTGIQAIPDARAVAQAKSWLATYRAKFDSLAQKSQAAHATKIALESKGAAADAARAALRALGGADPTAGETGLVTRASWSGHVGIETNVVAMQLLSGTCAFRRTLALAVSAYPRTNLREGIIKTGIVILVK
ncbi:Kinesin-related protein 6 [Grifola frondosa]|uniref:Kinesin-like protein n=1 Tax=Grifola frondosa TaxID=5627 RepID=A0A1C7MFU1_GRIFR|nr:Kinesin-related protein 6 [Grifola frondosa]